MEMLKGQLLVATPSLIDPNFFRSVTVLIEHNEEGALGLVITRPTKLEFREVWRQVRGETCEVPGKIHVGGPCQGPLMALHGQPEFSNVEVVSGLYFTQEPEQLQRLVDDPQSPLKFFVGFAGWGAGQLEKEMEEGSWLTYPADAGQVFGEVEELWDQLIRQRAGVLSFVKVRHVPADPSWN